MSNKKVELIKSNVKIMKDYLDKTRKEQENEKKIVNCQFTLDSGRIINVKSYSYEEAKKFADEINDDEKHIKAMEKWRIMEKLVYWLVGAGVGIILLCTAVIFIRGCGGEA